MDDFKLDSFNKEIDWQINIAMKLYEQTKQQSFKDRANELEEVKKRLNDYVSKKLCKELV